MTHNQEIYRSYEGGAAKIKGKVTIHNYNSAGTLISTYPAADEDVYIIYGNENSFYDNDVKTSYDGSFEFRYLQKGNYEKYSQELALAFSSKKLDVELKIKKIAEKH